MSGAKKSRKVTYTEGVTPFVPGAEFLLSPSKAASTSSRERGLISVLAIFGTLCLEKNSPRYSLHFSTEAPLDCIVVCQRVEICVAISCATKIECPYLLRRLWSLRLCCSCLTRRQTPCAQKGMGRGGEGRGARIYNA